ncbi:MAG TPA: type II secretion system protein GspM [Gammaproteobacteria bacterium]
MKAWFENLAPRERWMVAGGAVLAVIIVLWGFVLAPLSRSSAALAQSVAAKQRLLLDLRRAETLAPADGGGAAAPAQSLVVLVDTTRQPHGLTFDRTRPNGPNEIAVTFQNAPFDALLDWLIAIETNHGIVVDSASFSTARRRGLVNGQVQLRRP